jgi:hypothetical protein
MPMVMVVLHPTGDVGLVGSAELPQPDSIAANAMHKEFESTFATCPP